MLTNVAVDDVADNEFRLSIDAIMHEDGTNHGAAEIGRDFRAAHATGTQLRHRLVTPESIAELAATTRPSLLQRLLRRH
ncbi:hypothetical protein SAMN05518801_12410 [Novosphingobium sp. CF614]|uniref:hypothetical protein n=1 Tax=Novosphingobium sp. CF614 TaxID=1884364 RepID=UPI0008EE1BB0|nr:hypothetical protein [Novosphingobium sp. CF614]SFG41578.1 hypothetical protein SAMN05518801_12410 [Novosphingobium sp. CF614]